MSLDVVPDHGAVDHLTVRPLPDPVVDQLGYEPRSSYVETYWLGILGPTTTWLLRRIVAGFDDHPEGYALDLVETARCLGLGDRRSRHSPFARALRRLVQFDLARVADDDVLAVRRRVPPLSRRQVVHLPPSLQAAHEALQEAAGRTPPTEEVRKRARRLALSLVELGEDVDGAEAELLRWRYHPVIAREAAEWAAKRHKQVRTGGDAA